MKRWGAIAVGVAVFLVIAVVLWPGGSSFVSDDDDDPEAQSEGFAGSGGVQPAPVASVAGEVLLEQEPQWSPPRGSETEGEEAPPRKDVELKPAADCTVVAWQDGVRVAAPAGCDPQGRYEVVLEPGVSGRTAFEILVPGRLRAVIETDVPEGGAGQLPAVALGVAQTVSGQVVDGRGSPLRGVAIEAMPIPNLGEPEPWRARTDEDGNFAIDTLPPGPVALRGSKVGYTPSVVEAIAPQDDVLVVLDGLFDLEGRVAGNKDLVARARVRIEGSGIWPAKESPVDASGRFSFPRIPDGVYAIEAVVTSEDGPEFASIPLENVSPDLHVTVALTPAFRLPVRVVDKHDGPIEGARVTIGNSQIGLLQRVATTDEDGSVSVGPLVPGPYVVRVDADGYLPADPLLVTVSEEAAQQHQVRLLRPGRIEGIVVDENGVPVPDAVVFVEGEVMFTAGEASARAQMFEQALVAAGTLGVTKGPVPEIPKFGDEERDRTGSPRTDGDGRFVLDELVPGTYTLEARHGKFAASVRRKVAVRAGETITGVKLVLRTGYPLTGRVSDGNGRPIRSATVELRDGSVYRTDRKGTFDAGLRRGDQRLVARALGLAAREVRIAMRGAAKDVEIQLQDADSRLHGRATDDNGRAIAGVRVTVHMRDGLSATRLAWTDERGVFALEQLPSGSAEVHFSHAEYVATSKRVTIDPSRRDPVDAALRTGWSLTVTVLEPGTRELVGGATVSAGGRREVTNPEGTATLSPLGKDAVRVEVRAPGFTSKAASVSRPPSDHAELTVTLIVGGAVAGRVSDYRGDPVPGALVVVRDSVSEVVLGRQRTRAGGRYRLEGIREGDIRVDVYPPTSREEELAAVAQSSDILAGHVTKDVDVRLERR